MCILATVFAVLTILHYSEQLGLPGTASREVDFGLTRHALDRILFLVPVAYAGFLFGARGGGLAVVAALAVMLPRAVLVSPVPTDAATEALAVGVIGGLTVIWFEGQLRHQRRRDQLFEALRATQTRLWDQVDIATTNAKRLGALNAVASIASQSLLLRPVLNAVVDKVMEVMETEVALVFLVDEAQGDLALEVYRGVGKEFAAQLRRMEIGEGLNGAVAAAGTGMAVNDAASDPRLARDVVRREGIHSTLIAPIRFHGEVVGTTSVAVRYTRHFSTEDVDFLTAIGDAIGIAIGNARLYEEQLRTAEQLRVSEENYRGLFENAQDAIWVEDIGGMILTANRAYLELTGYQHDELVGMEASELLPENPQSIQARIQLMKGLAVDRPYDQILRKKDGGKAAVQVSASLASGDQDGSRRPLAFQCIARDVTEERRLQENLRFYRRQVTMAQEEERKRIARDLHDETAQGLVALSHRLDALASDRQVLGRGAAEALEELRKQTDQLLAEVRRFSQELRPSVLDHLGFVPAVESLVSEIAEWHGIQIDTTVTGPVRRLSPEVELGLFRIVQEALRNICKHSGATWVETVLEFAPDLVTVLVRDDGKGFDLPERVADLPVSGRLGLAGMAERADLMGGSLQLESAPGNGTSVAVEVAA